MSASAPPSVNGMANVPYPDAGDGPDYSLPKQYHSQKTKIRVACIGAGPSGLCLAYKMEKQMTPGTWELTIFDKNPAIGGTWFENTYPGCACDIPAHIYTYSWDPNPDWKTFFAYSADILAYFENFADKGGYKKYVKTNAKVIQATWDEQKGIYNILLRHPETGEEWHDWSHVLVNATGNLNKWKWPTIKGLHSFQAPLMHSAAWNHDVDFTNKTVAVIGTGSTAIQIVPQLQKVAKNLKLFMRSPTWISPPFAAGVLKEDVKQGQDSDISHRQYVFSELEQKAYRERPEELLRLRRKMEAEINLLFPFYTIGSPLQIEIHKTIRDEMERRIGEGHEKLKENLIPTWRPGCRRMTPGDGYLEALVQDNVQCIFKEINEINAEGLVSSDGDYHQVDIIVCATGFDVPYIPHFKLINTDGVNIQDAWQKGPNLYSGITAPNYPNYFVCIGPGGTWSNGSILPALETSCEHFIRIFNKMQDEGIKSIEVTQEACDDFFYHLDKFHEDKVWRDDCSSWFKNNGRIWVWPGATIHYMKTLNSPPRYEDYRIKYWKGRRFAYLGDGTVKAMRANDIDQLAPYIRNSDHLWSVE